MTDDSTRNVPDRGHCWPAELAAAYVAAQAELGDVAKGRTARVDTRSGPGYEYRYADLADVLGAVRPVLARHGLAVSQDIVTAARCIEVTTTLVHATGQTMTFGPLAFDAGGTPQQAGSAVTYGRRYALLAALGLATEDDDGATATQAATAARKPASGRTTPAGRATASMVTEAQLRAIGAGFTALGITDRAARLAWVAAVVDREVDSSKSLTKTEAGQVLDRLALEQQAREATG